jgi:hypothetical protein
VHDAGGIFFWVVQNDSCSILRPNYHHTPWTVQRQGGFFWTAKLLNVFDTTNRQANMNDG